MKRLFILILICGLTATGLAAAETKTTKLVHEIDYLIESPSKGDLKDLKKEGKSPRLLIAIGRQNGTKTEALMDLKSYWKPFTKAGYHVVMPLTKDGKLYFQGLETHIKPLIESLRKDLEFDKIVLAGVSNGGSSTFSIAIQNPEDYDALIAIPGMMFASPTFAQFLRGKPVFMRVGAQDGGTAQGVEMTVNLLRQVGARVDVKVVPDAGHIMPIKPQEMIDWLDKELSGSHDGS